jgi:hypothetical protein
MVICLFRAPRSAQQTTMRMPYAAGQYHHKNGKYRLIWHQSIRSIYVAHAKITQREPRVLKVFV